MHILAQLPQDFWVIVVVIFGGVFMVVLFSFADAQAKGGWSSFVKRYPAPTRPAGKAYRVPSWTYCNVHWRAQSLRVIFTDTGIYFYMTFHRRLAHPPFLLPWESVKGIKQERGLMGEYSVLEIEDAVGKLKLDMSQEIAQELAKHGKLTLIEQKEK